MSSEEQKPTNEKKIQYAVLFAAKSPTTPTPIAAEDNVDDPRIDKSTGLLIQPPPQRNPDYRRLTEILDSILDVWYHCPSLRLGQLLDNAMNRARDHGGADLFNIQDEDLVRAVKEFEKRYLCGNQSHPSSENSGTHSGTCC